MCGTLIDITMAALGSHCGRYCCCYIFVCVPLPPFVFTLSAPDATCTQSTNIILSYLGRHVTELVGVVIGIGKSSSQLLSKGKCRLHTNTHTNTHPSTHTSTQTHVSTCFESVQYLYLIYFIAKLVIYYLSATWTNSEVKYTCAHINHIITSTLFILNIGVSLCKHTYSGDRDREIRVLQNRTTCVFVCVNWNGIENACIAPYCTKTIWYLLSNH